MVTLATLVNEDYMLGHLTSYFLVWKSRPMSHSQRVYEFNLKN
jgi:hypothetical protein